MKDPTRSHPRPDELRRFADGKLHDAACLAVEEHLVGCDDCVRLLQDQPVDRLLLLARQDETVQEGATGSTPAPALAPTIAHVDQTAGPGAPDGVALPADLAGHARYRITRLLGQGGRGTVYVAEHRLMERTVALKIIHPNLMADAGAVERFEREVKAAARLIHPHIVTAYDAEHAGDTHFLIMEHVDGRSLGDYLREKGQLPVAEACIYARQAALGLQHAHEQGMIHRDIKPDNLMRTAEGSIKILDFGLARFAQSQPEKANHSPVDPGSTGAVTSQGTVMGTPDYLAPEQARDARQADIRADIYGLGCTLYQMLAGRVPFPEGSNLDKIVQHTTATPLPLRQLRPDVSPGLAAVVERMMAKAPAARYQTPGEAADALLHFSRPAARKHRWLRRLTAVGALLLLAIATYRIQTSRGELVIQTDDPSIEVVIQQGGRLVRIRDPQGKQTWELDTEKFELGMADQPGGLRIALPGKEPFTLRRGERGVLTVERRPAVQPPLEGRFVSLFNGKDLSGWTVDGAAENYSVDPKAKVLVATAARGIAWLFTELDYAQFHLSLEFQPLEGANSGIAVLAVPGEGGRFKTQLEVQVADDAKLAPYVTGTIFAGAPPKGYIVPRRRAPLRPADEWNKLDVELRERILRVRVNGQEVSVAFLDQLKAEVEGGRIGLARKTGRIGLQSQAGTVRYRNIRVK